MEIEQITAPLPKDRTHPPEGVPAEGNGDTGNHGTHDNGDTAAGTDRIDLNVPRTPMTWVVAVGVVGAVVLAALFIVGLVPRLHTNTELAADAEAVMDAAVPVNIVAATRAPADVDVTLPGTLRPWQEVSIFAQTTGYLKAFYVDISNQVKAGQLMADIRSPQVDEQLNGAKASLVQQEAAAAKAKTDLDYAEITDKRYESLRGTSGVTQQELDQYKSLYNSALATLRQAEANVGVAKATVQQLTEMQSFEKIYTPFAGVVTGRAYDVGALIVANPTTADVAPMFKLAENDVLRAFVNVPQSYALMIHMGMKVTVTARERPGQEFTGIVLGTTNYLDPAARSLLTEVRIENPLLTLLPGMYVQTVFHVTRQNPPLLVPAPSLVINADGNQVGIVQDNKVHFQKVSLGIDYGNDIEIVAGLNGDEQIIGNPGEKTIEGATVKIAGQQTTPAPGGAPPGVAAKIAEAK